MRGDTIKIPSRPPKTDLRYIQELLEYKNSKTTEKYTHVSRKNLGLIVSPLDSMEKGGEIDKDK